MSAVGELLAMTREEHRVKAAAHLSEIPQRKLTTSEGHALAAIAHALLALTAPEESKP